jgi:hypothetical protein
MNSMADLPTTSSSSQIEVEQEQQKTRSNSGNNGTDQGTPLSPVSLSSVDVDSASIHQCLSKAVACCAFFHTFEGNQVIL